MRLMIALVAVGWAARLAASDDYVISESGDATFRHNSNISWLTFLPSEKQIVSSASDYLVRLWDVADRRLLAERAFRAKPQLLTCDEQGLICFDEKDGFLELDPQTLQPVRNDADNPAIRFLQAVHNSYPGRESRVHRLWRLKGSAMACIAGRRFCFATRSNPNSWVEIENGLTFAPGGMCVVYSDKKWEGARLVDENVRRHIICERFHTDGTRIPLYKLPYPKEHEFYWTSISDNGELLACVWARTISKPGAPFRETYAVDVYRVADQVRVGRIECGDAIPRTVQFCPEGTRMLVACLGWTADYEVKRTELVEQSRVKDGYASVFGSVTVAPSLDVLAFRTHGNGFAVIDPTRPDTARLRNAVNWQPVGLLGDDTVLLKSELGVRSAPVAANGVSIPEIRLPPTCRIALADDRSCLIYALDDRKVTIRRPDEILLQNCQFSDRPIDVVGVSGDGKRFALANDAFVRMFERQSKGDYVEIHSFDANESVRRLMLSADGRALLTLLETRSAYFRGVVHHDNGKEWRICCGPFDYDPFVNDAAFASDGRLVVSLGTPKGAEPRQMVIMETRRVEDDTLLESVVSEPPYLLGRQLGRDGRIPLVNDRTLFFRDLVSHQKQERSTTRFQQTEWPRIACRDLGFVIVMLPDGRLAVRSIKFP